MTIANIDKVVNVGAGTGQIFQAENANGVFELRTLKQGTGITISTAPGEVTIQNSAPAPSKIYWETPFLAVLGYNRVNGQYIANPNGDTYGYALNNWANAAKFESLHEGYDSGTIQLRLTAFYKQPITATTDSISIRSRWFANNDNMNIAFSNGPQTISFTPTTGANQRAAISSLVSLTPDGSYSAGKSLYIRFAREDGNANELMKMQFKLRYQITL